MRRKDERLVGDVVEVGHCGRLERKDHVVALLADTAQHAPDRVQVEGRVLLEQVESEHYVSRRHRRAIAPLDALADSEREGLVAVAPRPLGGQHRRRLAVLERVDVHERLVEKAGRT